MSRSATVMGSSGSSAFVSVGDCWVVCFVQSVMCFSCACGEQVIQWAGVFLDNLVGTIFPYLG